MLDDLDRHMAAAGDVARATVPMGMFLAWCGHLQLISSAFEQAHETALLRLRYRELSPAEFFTACTGGSIDLENLNAQGRAFAELYYPQFLEDLQSVFGPDVYQIHDNWDSYDAIAPLLTRRFMTWKNGAGPGDALKARKRGSRKWWQPWKS